MNVVICLIQICFPLITANVYCLRFKQTPMQLIFNAISFLLLRRRSFMDIEIPFIKYFELLKRITKSFLIILRLLMALGVNEVLFSNLINVRPGFFLAANTLCLKAQSPPET